MYQQFQICRKQMRSQQIDDHIDKQYNQVSNLCQVVCKITPAVLSLLNSFVKDLFICYVQVFHCIHRMLFSSSSD